MATNFHKHEANIVRGSEIAFHAWVNAGVEAYNKGMKPDKYAQASNPKHHSVSTVTEYVRSAYNAMKKYKDKKAMLDAYAKAGYSYSSYDDFRKWATQFGQRANSVNKVAKPLTARTLTASNVSSDLRKAGFSSIEINAIVKALGLNK